MVGVFSGLLFGAALLAMPSFGAEQAVAHRVVAADAYQSFIGNWDEKATPVLYALIRSPAEWDLVFHPAAVMRQKKPFAPDAKTYETQQLLVVARAMNASKGDAFAVEKLSADGDVLTLRYKFNEPKSGATYTVKSFLGLFVPKHDYAKVVLIENGKQVGSLDLKNGPWSVPAFPKAGKE